MDIDILERQTNALLASYQQLKTEKNELRQALATSDAQNKELLHNQQILVRKLKDVLSQLKRIEGQL